MKIITVKVHGILDYLVVVGFAVAPGLLGLSGLPAYLAYILAVVHLLMTLLTDFPAGLFKVLPVKVHKIVERIVGPVLIASPWVLGFSYVATARAFYVAAGIGIAIVGLVTNYGV